MRVKVNVGKRRRFTLVTVQPLKVSLRELPNFLAYVVSRFAERHKRLFGAHREFLETVLTDSDVLPEVFRLLWRGYPRGNYKSLYICTDNALARNPGSKFCVIVRVGKANGTYFVDKVFVGPTYRPSKWATWYIYLGRDSWAPEDLEEGIEKLLREAGTF